jgi:hypothetical protein
MIKPVPRGRQWRHAWRRYYGITDMDALIRDAEGRPLRGADRQSGYRSPRPRDGPKAGEAMSGAKRYTYSQLPLSSKKHPQNTKENQEAAGAANDTFKPRWKASLLKWERVNDVTYKLTVQGKVSHTPASHGQWPGCHTDYPAAWLMNTNWWHGNGASWVGRCRDERGDWSFGPTTFEEARRETKDWVLGKSVAGGFTDNPIRDLHESALLSAKSSYH